MKAIVACLAATMALALAVQAWGQASMPTTQDFFDTQKKQMDQFTKDALGATDEEWKVLSPKIDKVRYLKQEIGTLGGKHGGFMWIADENQLPDTTKKLDAMRKLLKAKDSKSEDIASALKEFRDARAKSEQAMEKVQKELKDLVTVRQEAALVTMDLLQ